MTILADVAIRGEDLDQAAAEKAKSKAQKIINAPNAQEGYAEAAFQLANAVAQLRVMKLLHQLKKRH